eukprot:TRINITY_DN1101_c0_g1_i1.p1 TRINITY_DN1101_c0_g1~~TRINITY_DN1101_c0_g1_i1.p1  ORF type:complete len:1060 (-),score=638.57 TRINITY_DN1101_c0_g1_i1:76-3255(-)
MPIAVSADIYDNFAGDLLDSLFNASTADERKTIAVDLAAKFAKTERVYSAFNGGILKRFETTLGDKKNMGAREGVLIAISALAEKLQQQSEAYLLPTLTMILEAHGDKQRSVAKASEAAAAAICKQIPAHALKVLLPYLVEALEVEKAWQTKVGALNMISKLAVSAPAQMDKALPDVIPAVSQCMWDSKPDVCKAATRALTAICKTVSNPDLHPFIPVLVETIKEPSNVPETVYKLASTTFVTTVEAPSLAIMAPILGRGLSESTPSVLRQTSVIIDNMCKLVETPSHTEQFLPKLLPGLNRLIATAADPELRSVATRAKTTLVRVSGGKEEIPEQDSTVTAQKIKAALDDAMNNIKVIGNAVNADLGNQIDSETLTYVGKLTTSLVEACVFDVATWATLSGYFASFTSADNATKIATQMNTHFHDIYNKANNIVVEKDNEEGEELCDCSFSLAYGGMILLNNAHMRLTRGQKYGLCGPNGVGKSTLLRAISNGQLEGFPSRDVLKTVFVEHNLQASDAEKPVLDFVVTDPEFTKVDPAVIKSTLQSVGFDDTKLAQPVGALSGGWKMKLELARAMIMKADILLLDEPTNHLDVANVAWLTKYLKELTSATAIIVSHDSGFLNNVCTHVIQYQHMKLKTFKGNLTNFVKHVPEAKSYFTLEAAVQTFKFPAPGFLDGVKSTDKAILKMTKAGFQYPGTTKPQVIDASVQVALASRVACLGPNGAGKSTLIKLLTGETEPNSGTVWKHPNLRVAYVAQHAFHHIDEHLDKTPNEYIRWRYELGEDRELMAKATRQMTEEDLKALRTPVTVVVDGVAQKRVIEVLVGRRKAKRSFEYECKFVGKSWEDNHWFSREKLEDMGLQKVLQAYDDKEAAREGLYIRPLTAVNIQKHLEDIGLAAEFATHSRIRGLSGGQKVKVVIGAAMWNNPHILVLDEPTNFLDRDSLGALAGAIKEWGGGVVMISHHSEFVDALCPEKWSVDAGRCTVTGSSMPAQIEKLDQVEQLTTTDGAGNTVKVKSTRKLTRKEIIQMKKKIAAKEANGEDLDSDEEDFIFNEANGKL